MDHPLLCPPEPPSPSRDHILYSGTPEEPQGKSQGLPLAAGVCLPCLPMGVQNRMGGGKDAPGLSHLSLTGARGLRGPPFISSIHVHRPPLFWLVLLAVK